MTPKLIAVGGDRSVVVGGTFALNPQTRYQFLDDNTIYSFGQGLMVCHIFISPCFSITRANWG
jgi:hypothetical protein